MEAILIEVSRKLLQPDSNKGVAFDIKLNYSSSFLDDPESDHFGKGGFFWRASKVELVNSFEFDVKGEFRMKQVFRMCLVWFEDG